VIVGNFYDTESGVFEMGPNVFVEQAYDFGIAVEAINDVNVMVGLEDGHPALWDGVDPGFLSTTTISCGAQALLTGINSAGVIVGVEYDCLPNYSDTYRWRPRLRPEQLTRTARDTL
jgi:hypothetical protein